MTILRDRSRQTIGDWGTGGLGVKITGGLEDCRGLREKRSDELEDWGVEMLY